jgi:hypothetical protein
VQPRSTRSIALPVAAIAPVVALVALVALLAFIAVACSGVPGASPAASGVAVPSFSLLPAAETSTPAPFETPAAPPDVGLPDSLPPPIPSDAAQAAEELSSFVAAFGEGLQEPDLADPRIAAAGARLCAYLQQHADPSGIVDAVRALAAAEVDLPGYPRELWTDAFELASSHVCTNLTFEAEGQG